MHYNSIEAFLNTSPFISGCVMLMMNLGGKYITMDIPKGMHYFFANPWIRKLTVFCIAFVATRNIKTALLLALLFILFSRFLMNEKSNCCIPFIKEFHNVHEKAYKKTHGENKVRSSITK